MNYGIQGNGRPNLNSVFSMLDYALEHGISDYDTASAYGEAEIVLGKYIRQNPDKSRKMRVISKLKPDAFSDSDRSRLKDIVVDNVCGSIDRLGVDALYSYLFHNASYVFDQEAVEALCVAKEKGYAAHIGVSVYSPSEAMKALDYPEIDTIQVPYNLFDRRLDKTGFFDKAKRSGVQVYARSSLLQGLAVMKSDSLPDNMLFAGEYLKKFELLCDEFNISRLNAAIGYVGNKNGIDYVVFGVDNLDQLKEYISLENEPMSDELIKAIDKAFDDVPEKLVNPSMWR